MTEGCRTTLSMSYSQGYSQDWPILLHCLFNPVIYTIMSVWLCCHRDLNYNSISLISPGTFADLDNLLQLWVCSWRCYLRHSSKERFQAMPLLTWSTAHFPSWHHCWHCEWKRCCCYFCQLATIARKIISNSIQALSSGLFQTLTSLRKL